MPPDLTLADHRLGALWIVGFKLARDPVTVKHGIGQQPGRITITCSVYRFDLVFFPFILALEQLFVKFAVRPA